MDEKEIQKPPENKKTVVFSSKPKEGLFHRLLSNRKRKTIVLICVLIVIAIAASVYLLFIQEKAVVTVAGKNIYKSDIQKEELLYNKAWSAAQGEKNKQDNYELAKKQLTIQAIINAEAKKRGVTVSQQEIDKEYKLRSSDFTSDVEFIKMMKSSYGWSKDDLLNKINLDLLQAKLESLVVKGYNGTVVYVRYDIYKDNQNLIDTAKAKADEIFSQLKNGVKVSDIIKTYENDPIWGHPFLGSFEYSDVNASNEKSNFEGREDWQNISGLTKSGDVSGVYKSGGGYFGIAILGNKTSGTYDSWDAFINAMMKSSVSFNSTIKTNIIATFKEISKNVSASFSSIYKQLVSVFIPPKAGAICENNCLHKKAGSSPPCCLVYSSCTLGHMATVKVTVKDKYSHLPISGATITMRYNGHNSSDLCSSQIDASTFTEITNSNGVANFYLSCWINYTITFSHPHYKDATIDADYKPDNGVTSKDPWNDGTPKQWTITPTVAIDKTTTYVGDSATTWTHTITNAGQDQTDQDIKYDYASYVDTPGNSTGNGANHSVSSGFNVGDNRSFTSTPYTAVQSDVGHNICRATRVWTYTSGLQSSSSYNGVSGNGSTSDYKCVYVSPRWTVDSKISIDSTIHEPGDVVHWTHSIYNQGPDATSNVNYYWQNYGYLGSGTGGASSFTGLGSGGTKFVPASSPYIVTQNDVGNSLCRSTVAYPRAWNDPNGNSIAGICTYIPYNYTLIPSVSLDHSGAIDAGTSFNVTPGVTVPPNNITKSKSTQWQITQIVVVPSGTVPNSAGGDSNSYPCGPATFYFRSLPNAACSTIGSGTTVFNEVGARLSGSMIAAQTVVAGDYEVGTKICYAFSVQPRSSLIPFNAANDNQWAHTAPKCLVIGKHPKTQILGGDLIVGGDVNTSTSTKNNVTYGSWAEYGIIAAGGIKGAASGSAFAGPGITGSYTASNSSYLSFANTNVSSGCSPTQPTATVGCYKSYTTISDVAAHFPVTSSTSLAVPDIATLSSGTYKAVSNISISPNSNITKDHSIIINAKGFDVTITRNITYDKADSLTSISQVPQVVIIANNIKIAGGVTNIDAWLIAQGGYINTCSEVAIGGNLSSNICKDKLVVNGPVMTDKLYLYRTAGSGTGANSGDPAEVFNLPADAYLWAMAQASTQKNHIQTVYTTELPPRY